MSSESCTKCIHLWVCGLPASPDHEVRCPGFMDKDKVKEVAYARWEFEEPDAQGNRKPCCSNCLEYKLASWSDYIKCKVCPNCGALMWLGDFDNG